MIPERPLKVGRVHHARVIGAHDPEGFVRERDIEQRLVQMTLGALGVGASGVQRFADADAPVRATRVS